MSSIQQSINQGLQSAQFAASVYSQTPQGKTASAVTAKKQKIKNIGKQMEQGNLTEHVGLQRQAELAEQLYDIKPTNKHFNMGVDFWEKQMEAEISYNKRIHQVRDIKSKTQKRIVELKNARARASNQEKKLAEVIHPAGGMTNGK